MAQKNSELFFGLVGAVGTNLSLIVNSITSLLLDFNYKTEHLKLSNLIARLPAYSSRFGTKTLTEDQRISSLMDEGDSLRKSMKCGEAVVILALDEIRRIRNQHADDEDIPLESTAYIFDSIKNPAEARFLRSVYGSNFFLISVYSPALQRINRLTGIIAKSRKDLRNSGKYENDAKNLVRRDENSNDKYGQNVGDVFHLADFFVRINDEPKIRTDLKRFLDIIFGYPYHTPTRCEMGMFLAKTFSLRSADLSRQVGAVVMTPEGEMLTGGCNDVPRSGGGLPWPEETDVDHRDFQNGYDSSAATKKEIIKEILLKLSDRYLNTKLSDEETAKELAVEMLTAENGCLKDSLVANSLEYGRIIHAEMNAITDAAKRGIALKDSILFCTTFPCHICARHIIAAGISKVFFIEPYPKSMAKTLYPQSIRLDDESKEPLDSKCVEFLSFEGISPNRFMEFFSMIKRKDDEGNVLIWSADKATPKIRLESAYTEVEKLALSKLDEYKRYLTQFSELPDESKDHVKKASRRSGPTSGKSKK